MEKNDESLYEDVFDIGLEIKKLLESINNFNDYSRYIYANLSKLIPKSIQRINRSIRDLDYNVDLISNLDIDNPYSLNNFIDKTVGTIDDFVNFFHNSTKVLEEQFYVISSRVKDIEILESVIDKMKSSSIDMEIMSINTLTVAMRAGKAGGAFSYITGEIKFLTQSMISQAEHLNSKGKEVKLGLDKTKDQIYNSTNVYKEMLNDFKENLITTVDEFSDNIGDTIALFDDILKALNVFKAQFVNSISCLQIQDRLTQSLQHLNMMFISIEAFKVKNVSELQKLKTLAIFIKCSKMIIKDCQDKLGENIKTFEQFIKTITEAVENINDLKSNNSLYIDIPKHIDSFTVSLNRLLKTIGDVEKSNVTFIDLYYEQIKLVKSLEFMFSNISSISSRFQNINIASKIEVIKRIELEDMESNISEMSKIIVAIDESLVKGIEFLEQIIFFIEKVVKDYDNKFYLEKNYFNKFKNSLVEIRDNAFEIKEVAMGGMLAYDIFPIDFSESINNMKLEITNLSVLKNMLSDLEVILNKIDLATFDELALQMVKSGVQDVEIEDKEFLNKIANRFTLYAHKKYLLSLMHNTEERKSFDEGSIILF